MLKTVFYFPCIDEHSQCLYRVDPKLSDLLIASVDPGTALPHINGNYTRFARPAVVTRLAPALCLPPASSSLECVADALRGKVNVSSNN